MKSSKVLIILYFLLSQQLLLQAQNFTISGDKFNGKLQFHDSNVQYNLFNGGVPIEGMTTSTVTYKNKLRYLTLNEPINKTYLFLKSDYFSL